MCHGPVMSRQVNNSFPRAAVLGLHNPHVDIVVLDLGKQNLSFAGPHQPVVRVNSSACSPIGTWPPFGTIHNCEWGIERYISTGIATGKNWSPSPWMINLRSVVLAR